MSIRELALEAPQLSYAEYCTVLSSFEDGREVAFDFNLGPLASFFKELKEQITELGKQFGVGIADLVKAFKQKDIFALFKALGFNLKTLWKAVQQFTMLVPKGLIRVFQELEKTGALKALKAGTMKVDEVLQKYPLLKKLAGLAVAGFLLWAWLSMSFVGNPDLDFDVTDIVRALKGSFTLTDLFLSESGFLLISLLATGLFTGIGVAWFGETLYNLLFALAYTGAKKLRLKFADRKLAVEMEPKKY